MQQQQDDNATVQLALSCSVIVSQCSHCFPMQLFHNAIVSQCNCFTMFTLFRNATAPVLPSVISQELLGLLQAGKALKIELSNVIDRNGPSQDPQSIVLVIISIICGGVLNTQPTSIIKSNCYFFFSFKWQPFQMICR